MRYSCGGRIGWEGSLFCSIEIFGDYRVVPEEEAYSYEGQNDVDFGPDTWCLLECKLLGCN